jgi:hypothetical protein
MKAKTAMGAKGLIRHIEGTARRPLPFDLENGRPVSEPGKLATHLEIQEHGLASPFLDAPHKYFGRSNVARNRLRCYEKEQGP